MKVLAVLILACTTASAASRSSDEAIAPSLPLASPGIHASGNECAPDRAEAAWSRDHRLLGYYCVQAPSNFR